MLNLCLSLCWTVHMFRGKRYKAMCVIHLRDSENTFRWWDNVHVLIGTWTNSKRTPIVSKCCSLSLVKSEMCGKRQVYLSWLCFITFKLCRFDCVTPCDSVFYLFFFSIFTAKRGLQSEFPHRPNKRGLNVLSRKREGAAVWGPLHNCPDSVLSRTECNCWFLDH